MNGVKPLLNILSGLKYGRDIYAPQAKGFGEISVIETGTGSRSGILNSIGFNERSIAEQEVFSTKIGIRPRFKISSARPGQTIGFGEISIIEKRSMPSQYSNLFGIGCEAYNVTAESEPDLDGWGPDCYWEGEHWIKWHKLNVDKYGKAKADEKFQQWWSKRSVFGHELWIANNDGAFRAYIKQQGLDKSVPDLAFMAAQDVAWDKVGNIAGSVANTADNIVKTADNASAAAANTAGSVSTVAKWLPWIALAGVAIIAYLVVSKKSVNIL